MSDPIGGTKPPTECGLQSCPVNPTGMLRITRNHREAAIVDALSVAMKPPYEVLIGVLGICGLRWAKLSPSGGATLTSFGGVLWSKSP
jgi:hypothetical protein